jgi:hypothetical protein
MLPLINSLSHRLNSLRKITRLKPLLPPIILFTDTPLHGGPVNVRMLSQNLFQPAISFIVCQRICQNCQPLSLVATQKFEQFEHHRATVLLCMQQRISGCRQRLQIRKETVNVSLTEIR